MSIKSGQILHVSGGFVIDRIQTGGVSNLNIPQEKVYELGNYKTVATVRDIPDLSFEIESLDVFPEFEALLVGVDPTTLVDGDEIDFVDAVPLDVISPFKSAVGQFDVVKGVAVPYLTLESVQYRFGLRANATQTFTLRGDSVYYIPGTPKEQLFTITSGANQVYTLANTALTYEEGGDTFYVLSACVKEVGTNRYKRLFLTRDYTNTATTLTTLANWFADGYDRLHVVYGTAAAQSYPQTVHQNVSVKPAAVRGKDIEVWVSNGAATPVYAEWAGVQSVDVQRRVNLENDEEFGNYKFVGSDYDVADVTGNIVVKSVDPDDLFDKIAQIANVTTSEIAGAHSSIGLGVEIRLKSPDTGDVVKTIFIPDARFTVPNVQGRVQQKLQVTFNFTSDEGTVLVYNGERP